MSPLGLGLFVILVKMTRLFLINVSMRCSRFFIFTIFQISFFQAEAIPQTANPGSEIQVDKSIILFDFIGIHGDLDNPLDKCIIFFFFWGKVDKCILFDDFMVFSWACLFNGC